MELPEPNIWLLQTMTHDFKQGLVTTLPRISLASASRWQLPQCWPCFLAKVKASRFHVSTADWANAKVSRTPTCKSAARHLPHINMNDKLQTHSFSVLKCLQPQKPLGFMPSTSISRAPRADRKTLATPSQGRAHRQDLRKNMKKPFMFGKRTGKSTKKCAVF